jgi:hypothetical protein
MIIKDKNRNHGTGEGFAGHNRDFAGFAGLPGGRREAPRAWEGPDFAPIPCGGAGRASAAKNASLR